MVGSTRPGILKSKWGVRFLFEGRNGWWLVVNGELTRWMMREWGLMSDWMTRWWYLVVLKCESWASTIECMDMGGWKNMFWKKFPMASEVVWWCWKVHLGLFKGDKMVRTWIGRWSWCSCGGSQSSNPYTRIYRTCTVPPKSLWILSRWYIVDVGSRVWWF